MKNKWIGILILFAFIVLPTYAEETEPQKTYYHTIKFNAGGNYSSASFDKISMMYNTALGYSIEKNNLALNANTDWVYELQNKELAKNDFGFGLDFNYYFNDSKRFYAWGLNNYQSAYSLKINHQYQAGAGLAYQIIDLPYFFLRVSDGFLWETSNIIESEEALLYDTWRNSFRLQVRSKVADRLNFKFTGFWQPSIIDFNDQLIKINSQLLINIWKQLDLKIEGQYNLVTKTEKENLLISYGFSYQLKF